MNNSKFLEHKHLSHNSPSNKAPSAVITTVTYCLATHSKCNGRYVDNSGKYIILCDCSCHKSTSYNKEARRVGNGV